MHSRREFKFGMVVRFFLRTADCDGYRVGAESNSYDMRVSINNILHVAFGSLAMLGGLTALVTVKG